MTQLTVQPPEGRGCGHRSDGGIYACCGLSNHGMPIEYFLLDPVRPIPWQRGSHVVPRNDGSGIYDLLVYIGVDPKSGETEGYPSTWSFIEEARRYGVSRKQSPTLEFHKLTPGQSNMILAHPRAFAGKAELGKLTQVTLATIHLWAADYTLNRPNHPLYQCKQFQAWADHKDLFEKAGWKPGWDIRGGNLTECLAGGCEPAGVERMPCVQALRDLAVLCHQATMTDSPGFYQVKMPSFSFLAKKPISPESSAEIEWRTAAFMVLPLTHFEMPNGPQDEKGQEVSESLRGQGWECHETDY